MKFYQTKEFVKLQREWTKKLKESGFSDLEKKEGDKLPGQFYVGREIKRPERISSSLEYYTQASKFLWDFQFKTENERKIWFYHSEGYTVRQIATFMRHKSHTRVFQFLSLMRPVFLEYVKAQWEFENNRD